MSENVILLERSFELVKSRAQEFPNRFYATLFSDYPTVKPLFMNTHLEKQGEKLFDSLVLVVDNLRNPEVLDRTLKGLGTRHVKYGVLPEHYPMVGGSLLKTLEWGLESSWTPEVRQAWIEAYGSITQLMLAGADYPPEVLQLTN